MAEIASITVDDKARTVMVRLADGRGEIFGGTLDDYAAYVKKQSVASNDLIAVYSLMDAKLQVDPTLKDTTDIIAKPIEYADPVPITADPILVDPVIDEPIVGGK